LFGSDNEACQLHVPRCKQCVRTNNDMTKNRVKHADETSLSLLLLQQSTCNFIRKFVAAGKRSFPKESSGAPRSDLDDGNCR
jgi:hypothetical protein